MYVSQRQGAACLRVHLIQKSNINFAVGDFAQRDDGRLVLRINHGLVPLRELTCAISGNQNHLKAVRNLLEAVFNGNAGHLFSGK